MLLHTGRVTAFACMVYSTRTTTFAKNWHEVSFLVSFFSKQPFKISRVPVKKFKGALFAEISHLIYLL